VSTDLYVRDGSRFVRVGDTLIARDVPPLPVPVTVVEESDPAPNVTRVHAPRCPHGSFARWAARNCCAPGARRGR